MTFLYYAEFSSLLPSFVTFISAWIHFIYNTHVSISNKTTPSDKKKPTNTVKKNHYSSFVDYGKYLLSINIIYWFVVNDIESSFFWNQLKIDNAAAYLYTLILILFFFVFTISGLLKYNNASFNPDFFFCLTNVALLVPQVYFANSIMALIFIIELIAILLFYMFSVSKNRFEEKHTHALKETNKNLGAPKNYISMLFFNYWSTFFSSVLLFFSLICISSEFNTSEISIINYIQYMTIQKNDIYYKSYLAFVWSSFMLGFFIKIGITPLHLFKLEVYKGLPIISIMLYTCVFFVSYISYFLTIFLIDFCSLKLFISSFLFILLSVAIPYVAVTLFDLSAIKAFFAYSTVINAVIIFLICIAI